VQQKRSCFLGDPSGRSNRGRWSRAVPRSAPRARISFPVPGVRARKRNSCFGGSGGLRTRRVVSPGDCRNARQAKNRELEVETAEICILAERRLESGRINIKQPVQLCASALPADIAHNRSKLGAWGDHCPLIQVSTKAIIAITATWRIPNGFVTPEFGQDRLASNCQCLTHNNLAQNYGPEHNRSSSPILRLRPVIH
jgi:hypothetical protein